VPLDEISVEEWDRVMAVNLRGVFLACKAVLPAMRARGFGRIINIASGTAFSGPATRIHYVTSKAGVLGFTRTLAREVGAHGITVNTIAPGRTLSEEHPTEEIMRFRQSAIHGRAIPRLQSPGPDPTRRGATGVLYDNHAPKGITATWRATRRPMSSSTRPTAGRLPARCISREWKASVTKTVTFTIRPEEDVRSRFAETYRALSAGRRVAQ
jgi:NAD(P)-dependent dehydrogenase (short-subunit alcohol dehydrogenase family)